MKHLSPFILVFALCAGAEASWYWPFSSEEEKRPPRIAELLEPASVMIDEAYDLSADGKTAEAVEKFRDALRELARVEAENADRVQTPEFNTLKNKRATVTAAIDSLLLSEAQANARPIAVTDTTELQKKYDEKRAAERRAKEGAKAEGPGGMKLAASKLKARDFDGAVAELGRLLAASPGDVGALNLLAAAQAAKGDSAAAEKTLDKAIAARPDSYYAYYNMARLHLRSKGSKSGARLYYEAGRKAGGPVDAKLEELLK
jgi:tetratricopeptide (TPR) repeat protein